jgi:hypothetical protein
MKKNREDLVFNNLDENGKGCYIKFTFNSFGIIDSITYLVNYILNQGKYTSVLLFHRLTSRITRKLP